MQHNVLLVHGIDDTDASLVWLRAALERAGKAVFSWSYTPNSGDVGLDAIAAQIECHAPPDKFDLVGFSMGGLIARYYVQRLGGHERVHRLITISAPHNGTWTAYCRNNVGARQMRPGSDFLKDLSCDVQILERVRFVSIWTPFDLMILPAKSSILPVGTNYRAHVPAHPWMVRSNAVLERIASLLT